MDTDVRALAEIAKTYFDAAYEMDADKFASVFHGACSVTKIGEDGDVSVTPIETWLAAVRSLQAPKLQGAVRNDDLLSIYVERDLGLLKLKLLVPPRKFTDLLSCLRINGVWRIVQKVTVFEPI